MQETMADRLKKVQAETWRRHRYVHDENAQSWDVSEEALYLHEGGAAAGKQAADEGSRHGVAELAAQVAALRTGWDEDGLLETTSGVRKEKKRAVKVEISDDDVAPAAKGGNKGRGKAADKSAAAAATKPAGRSKTAGAATTTRGKRPSTTTTIAAKGKETAKPGPSTRARRGSKNE